MRNRVVTCTYDTHVMTVNFNVMKYWIKFVQHNECVNYVASQVGMCDTCYTRLDKFNMKFYHS